MNKLGILLTNVGTPEAPTPKAVRRYLAEFLWDPRVVKIPRVLWWVILHGVVLRLRPQKSARLYQKIWTRQGAPLLVYSQQQARGLQALLTKRLRKEIHVVLGMRYGNPSIAAALAQLLQENVNQLLVLPLYPQYSAVTTASTFDALASTFAKQSFLPQLRMVMGYATHPAYIDALAQSIKEYWQRCGRSEKLLFSFHGLPQKSIRRGDPYAEQCQQTAREVAEKLQLTTTEWQVVFQSRFRKGKWLEPYCVETLRNLAQAGCKKVDVVCPGFAADCLETLEEIAITYSAIFKKHGGEQLNYIPALNASKLHLETLAQIVFEQVQGWVELRHPRESGDPG